MMLARRLERILVMGGRNGAQLPASWEQLHNTGARCIGRENVDEMYCGPVEAVRPHLAAVDLESGSSN
jgi:hypothetical protein